MSSLEFSLFLVKKSVIEKADKAFRTVMGWSEEDLFRQPASFLFPADAHGRLDKLLENEDPRFDAITYPRVPLRVKAGGYVNFDMKIERQEDENLRLDFYKPGEAKKTDTSDVETADMYSFFNFVEQLLNTPLDGDLDLTMISMDALRDDSNAGLSEEQKDAARADIEAKLKSQAVGGQIGKLDEASYGLISAGDFDEEAFEEELKNVAKKLSIDPEALSSRSAKVKIDDRDIDPDKLRQALNHSRAVFVGEIQDDTELESLSGVLDGIDHNRKLIKEALEQKNYLTSQRSVSDNKENTISVALLQQGKVNMDRRIMSPDDFIVMADHPDLSFAHDIAQLDRMIRLRVMKSTFEREKPDFYEVCRSTIIQKEFAVELKQMLAKHKEEPRLVGFRIMGLPPVKSNGVHWDALNALAKSGHPLWIDRFGDAVIEGDSLGCLKDGFVEMPASMMRKLAGHFDGKDLMIKLVETWGTRDVRVISADLPDYELKTLAMQLGITFALEDAIDEGKKMEG